jgi:hypothetical protein
VKRSVQSKQQFPEEFESGGTKSDAPMDRFLMRCAVGPQPVVEIGNHPIALCIGSRS